MANISIIDAVTKYRPDDATLRQMTAAALKAELSQFSAKELGGGLFSAVYLVEANGQKMVLKIAPSADAPIMRHERDYIVNEANVLKTINEKIEIPAPRMIFFDDSCEICQVPYFFMSFMRGTPLMNMASWPSEEEIYEIKKQVGIITKKICSIQAGSFGIPVMPETFTGNNYDFVAMLFEMLTADAEDKNIGLPYISADDLMELIANQKDILNMAQSPCYIHTDTWPGNLMIEDNRLVGLIDYAAVLFGDPLMSHDFHDFDNLHKGFLAGYGKVDFTHEEMVRIVVYRIWQRLGMIVERGYRGYEDKDLYAWVLGEFEREVRALEAMG